MKIFDRIVQIADAREKSLKEPCYALGISCTELEQRLNALEPVAVEEVSKWLGISYYSFFFSPEESAETRIKMLRQRPQPGLWDSAALGQ